MEDTMNEVIVLDSDNASDDEINYLQYHMNKIIEYLDYRLM